MTSVMRFSFSFPYLGTGGFFSLVLAAFYFYCLFFLGDSLSPPFFVQIALLRGYLILFAFAFCYFLGSTAPRRRIQRGLCFYDFCFTVHFLPGCHFPPLFFFLRTKTRSMGVAKHRSRLWALWGVFRFYFLDSVGLHFFGREERERERERESKGKRGK